jgi:hypothetical protein
MGDSLVEWTAIEWVHLKPQGLDFHLVAEMVGLMVV